MWRKQPESPLDKKVKTALRFDFWSSYKFSQGNPNLHRNLLHGMAIGQCLIWPEEMLAHREVMMPAMKKELRTKPMPKGHSAARKPTLTPKKEYQTRWNIYDDMVATAADMIDLRSLLRYVVHDSAVEDRTYIDRPDGRSSIYASEPYMSYMREYIVRGKDTHSLAFNYLFGLAHQLLHMEIEIPTEYFMRDAVLTLASKWEDKHPNQEFWMPAAGDNPFIVPPAIIKAV